MIVGMDLLESNDSFVDAEDPDASFHLVNHGFRRTMKNARSKATRHQVQAMTLDIVTDWSAPEVKVQAKASEIFPVGDPFWIQQDVKECCKPPDEDHKTEAFLMKDLTTKGMDALAFVSLDGTRVTVKPKFAFSSIVAAAINPPDVDFTQPNFLTIFVGLSGQHGESEASVDLDNHEFVVAFGPNTGLAPRSAFCLRIFHWLPGHHVEPEEFEDLFEMVAFASCLRGHKPWVPAQAALRDCRLLSQEDKRSANQKFLDTCVSIAAQVRDLFEAESEGETSLSDDDS